MKGALAIPMFLKPARLNGGIMSTLLPTSFTMKPNFFTAASVLIDIAAAQACDKAGCVSELSKKVILSL